MENAKEFRTDLPIVHDNIKKQRMSQVERHSIRMKNVEERESRVTVVKERRQSFFKDRMKSLYMMAYRHDIETLKRMELENLQEIQRRWLVVMLLASRTQHLLQLEQSEELRKLRSMHQSARIIQKWTRERLQVRRDKVLQLIMDNMREKLCVVAQRWRLFRTRRYAEILKKFLRFYSLFK